MFRKLFILHRWFGVAGGLMVLVWYVSGIGVHWRALPRILAPDEQRRAAGTPFDPADATLQFSDVLASAGQEVREVQLRRAGSRLVYEVRGEERTRVVDARSGEMLTPITDGTARDVASTFMPDAAVIASEVLTRGDRFSSNLPAPHYRLTFNDSQRTQVYVSPTSAAVIARARVAERLYFTFASIPHFLTFNTDFVRNHDNLRYAELYVLNAVAALITLTGLTMFVMMIWRSGWLKGVGRRQFLIRKWHYIAGAALCVSTLLFVCSGFFLVIDGGTPPEAVLAKPAELRGILPPVTANASGVVSLSDALNAGARIAPLRVRSVTLKSVLGTSLYILQDRDGHQRAIRADGTGAFDVDKEWAQRVSEAFMGRAVNLGSLDYLTEYDSYYYARDKRFPPLPVYRIAGDDEEATVLYLSAASGEVVGRTTRGFRIRRWLVNGLHTWDFPFLLNRPWLRDAVVVTQIVGGFGLTLTGLYLGAAHCVAWSRGRIRNRRAQIAA